MVFVKAKSKAEARRKLARKMHCKPSQVKVRLLRRKRR